MGRCTMATVSTACILRWVMLRTMGMVIPYVSSNAFVGDDHSLALYLNSAWVCVWFEQMASATFIRTCFVITMFKLWCIWDANFYVNMWWWPLNLLWSWLEWKLVWNPSWFHGLPGYTGLSLLNRLLQPSLTTSPESLDTYILYTKPSRRKWAALPKGKMPRYGEYRNHAELVTKIPKVTAYIS